MEVGKNPTGGGSKVHALVRPGELVAHFVELAFFGGLSWWAGALVTRFLKAWLWKT